jgi:BirA family biotin operon repressor/biotin-[acetyl-CoA-carboxylase] ligase
MQIVRLDSVESTNKYCEVLDLAEVEDFTCYWALEQTAGIGQRGNHWHSAKGENLTFSLMLKPTWLAAARQFMLTQALSLAIVDFLASFTSHLSPCIKWPNDIYVGGKKICGTLTSARLAGDNIATAICGIGLNVNETDFPDWVPNPTSLRLLTGETYDLEEVLHTLLGCIERRYNALHDGADIGDEYLGLLLGRGEQRRYTYLGQPVTATIEGVDEYGRLLLTTEEGSQLCCNMKELAYSWL